MKKHGPSRPKPPARLSAATKKWWRELVNIFEFEAHHLRLLQAAAESWDTAAAAQAIIDKEGLTFTDRWGQPKPRPEVAIANNARITFARMTRELALDVGTPDDSRPPRLGGTKY
jgi:phage terminase small subunit